MDVYGPAFHDNGGYEDGTGGHADLQAIEYRNRWMDSGRGRGDYHSDQCSNGGSEYSHDRHNKDVYGRGEPRYDHSSIDDSALDRTIDRVRTAAIDLLDHFLMT